MFASELNFLLPYRQALKGIQAILIFEREYLML